MTLFPGFTETPIDTGEVILFTRHGGNPDKPPLVLLHGYPQTSAMWHGVAAALSDQFHILCPDLRGYGRSDKPASTPDHGSFSKRAMARDLVGLLDHFGYDSAFIGAHDRGARVAHRLGLDHPERARAMVLLDIAPTREMYAGTSDLFARAYWHWFFLIQPAPLPETLIGADPRGFWQMKCGIQTGGSLPFAPEALAEYLDCFDNPEAIRACCEDYRAAATIDLAHDAADDGAKLLMPVQVFWAEQGIIGRCFDPMALWRSRAAQVSGQALPGTHYFAEEHPKDIAARMAAFFDAAG